MKNCHRKDKYLILKNVRCLLEPYSFTGTSKYWNVGLFFDNIYLILSVLTIPQIIYWTNRLTAIILTDSNEYYISVHRKALFCQGNRCYFALFVHSSCESYCITRRKKLVMNIMEYYWKWGFQQSSRPYSYKCESSTLKKTYIENWNDS